MRICPWEEAHLRILSFGEVLWDVFGEQEYLGGAPLNFAIAARKLGNSVALLSSVGDDLRGSLTLDAIRNHELSTDFVQLSPKAPTGTAIVTADGNGNPSFAIARPAAFDQIEFNDDLLTSVIKWNPQWIYFGTLAQAFEESEEHLKKLVHAVPFARRFYDVNLRTGHWNFPLVQRLSLIASIIKMNETEAMHLCHLAGGPLPFAIETFCEFWSSRYGAEMICVTLGGEGCAVSRAGRIEYFKGFNVRIADTVGAGDAFAAGFLHGLNCGWSIERTATFANALGAIVASRAGATPAWTIDDCMNLIAADGTCKGS